MSDQGLKQLLMASRPALIRFLNVRGAAPDDAEDLVQELYVKLEGRRIGPVLEPRAYLYRMADNLLLDRRRSGMRRARREEDWASAGASAGGIGEGEARTSIEDALIAREQLRIVRDALAALPIRTAEIFRRFRVDGERQKIIAEDLGISVSAVEKHLRRAYDAVLAARAALDADMSDPRRQRGERERHGA